MSLVITGDLELQETIQSLKSEGKVGKKALRKGLRAGAKIVAVRVKATFPRKSGTAALSTKVKAMKRKKGRTGVRVTLFARTAKGFPYPVAQEFGAKPKVAGIKGFMGSKEGVGRTSKAGQRIMAGVGYRIQPGHYVEKATEATAAQALNAVLSMIQQTLESEAAKK